MEVPCLPRFDPALDLELVRWVMRNVRGPAVAEGIEPTAEGGV